MGAAIKKYLTHELQWKECNRAANQFSTHGGYQTADNLYTDLVLKQNKQTEYDAIIAHSNTMECPVTKATLYYKPEYTYGKTTEKESEVSRKRMASSSAEEGRPAKTANAKRKASTTSASKRKKVGDEGDENGGDDTTLAVKLDITSAQKNRMEKLIPNMQVQVDGIVDLLNEAVADKNKGAVTDAVMAKGNACVEKSNEVVRTIRAILKTEKAVKGEANEVFANAKAAQDEMKILTHKLRGDIDWERPAANGGA